MELYKTKLFKTQYIYEGILISTLLLSMILQMPSLISNSDLKFFSYILWIFVMVISVLISKPIFSRRFLLVFISSFPIILYLSFLDLGFGREAFFYREIFMVLGIITLGYFSGSNHINILSKLMNIYILSTIILAIDAYFNYLQGSITSGWNYNYPFKNSLGIIIVNSILYLFFKKTSSNFGKITNVILIILFFIVLFGLQNRTGIVVVIFAIIIVTIYKLKFFKSVITFSTVVFSMFIFNFLFSEDNFISQIIKKGLLLDVLSSTGVDGWSSSRSGMVSYGMSLFYNNPILGTKIALENDTYIESFYVQVISSYGILGFILVMIFLLTAIYFVINTLLKATKSFWTFYTFLLVIVMLIVGLTEQMAPFGPGTVYFLNWFLIGFILNPNFYSKLEGVTK